MVILALLLILLLPSTASALPAFPGAEGFGSTTVGGRDAATQILFVTNTNDNGAGSLRATFEASGPRIVIFKTGGTLNLVTELKIMNPYIYVAGQTAPGGGFLVKGPRDLTETNSSLKVYTHDVVIRGLRFRGVNRSVGFYADYPVYNIVFDHNSVSWQHDTVIDSYYAPHDLTWSWNIIAEGFGATSSGMLFAGDKVCAASQGYNMTAHHNLLAHNKDRSPLITSKVGSPEFINNLVYNWYWFGSRTFSTAAIVGNHYIAGPGTVSDRPVYVVNGGDCPSLQSGSVFVSHNIGQGRLTDTGDDWNIVDGGTSVYRKNVMPFTGSNVTIDNVANVKTKVLAKAGATIPSLDNVDIRIIADVNALTGHFQDNEAHLDWPTPAAGTYPTDTDGDGIPDAWETAHGLNPASAADAKTFAPSGYQWIEEYVNSLFNTVGQLTFTAVTGAELSTEYRSNKQTISGIDNDVAISVAGTGCQYSFDNVTYTANAGTVSLNDNVYVRTTSSGSYDTMISCTLTAGDTPSSYNVTTKRATVQEGTAIQSTLSTVIGGWE